MLSLFLILLFWFSLISLFSFSSISLIWLLVSIWLFSIFSIIFIFIFAVSFSLSLLFSISSFISLLIFLFTFTNLISFFCLLFLLNLNSLKSFICLFTLFPFFSLLSVNTNFCFLNLLLSILLVTDNIWFRLFFPTYELFFWLVFFRDKCLSAPLNSFLLLGVEIVVKLLDEKGLMFLSLSLFWVLLLSFDLKGFSIELFKLFLFILMASVALTLKFLYVVFFIMVLILSFIFWISFVNETEFLVLILTKYSSILLSELKSLIFELILLTKLPPFLLLSFGLIFLFILFLL